MSFVREAAFVYVRMLAGAGRALGKCFQVGLTCQCSQAHVCVIVCVSTQIHACQLRCLSECTLNASQLFGSTFNHY